MKLVYKILWIDNDDSIYKNHQDDIHQHLVNLGFEPQIVILKDFQSFEKANSEAQLDLKSYDLFILDYKLKNGDNGNKIVQEIREEHSIYTEIIFYSAVPEEARKQIFDDKLNGVYITSRKYDDFEDDVLGIIDVTIKKVQDVNNLRGLIMAEVAELDRIKEEIIQKFNLQANSEFKKYVKEKVFSKIKEELKNLNCLISVGDSECSYDDIDLEKLQKNFFYDTFKKSRTVNKIKKQKCNTIEFRHEDYYQNVIAKRNVFAHEKEYIREDGTRFLRYPNGEPLEFTEEHCIEIRKEIRKYKKLLKEISIKI